MQVAVVGGVVKRAARIAAGAWVTSGCSQVLSSLRGSRGRSRPA